MGTFVETEDEIERMLELTDPDLIWLGPDTGHLAWAGVDVVAFCERHAERIKTMHIKDVNGDVRDRGIEAGWDYATFCDNGIWTEIGTGCVDFAKIFAVLSSQDFSGWLVVETDVTQLSSPLESATVSRQNLRRFGL
jgi:inosose dehydratase